MYCRESLQGILFHTPHTAFTKFHMSEKKLASINVSYLDYSTGVDRNHGTYPTER